MKTYRMVTVALFSAAAALFQLLNGVIGIPTGFGMTVDLAALPVMLAFFMFGFESALSVCVLLTFIITLVAPTSFIGASMKFAATLPMILLPALWLLAGKRKKDAGRVGAILVLSILVPLLFFVFSGIANTSVSSSKENVSQGSALYTVPELKIGSETILKPVEVTSALLIEGLAPMLLLGIATWVALLLWRRYGSEVDTKSFRDKKTIIVVTFLALIVRGILMVVANMYYAGPLFFGASPEQYLSPFPIGLKEVFQVNLPLWVLIFVWNAIQGVIELAFAWTIAFKFKFAEYYGS